MRWSPAFPFRRSGRWVLVVRAGGARLFRGSRRTIRAVADLTADEAGYAELRGNVEGAAPRPIHVLVDLVEEDFRRETAPHVHGPARRSVLATRSARLFPGTPYVSARREGRMPEGRRDDRVLFSAIVRPERVEPWLDVLHGREVAGVHSLPIVSAGLLPLLGAGTGRVLLVTESGDRELRQTYFEDGRLTLSRLAPLPPGEPADRARRIVAEVERLVHHLGRSGRSTEGLGFRIVGGEPLLAAIRDSKIPRELAEGLVDTATVERRLRRRSRARTDEPHGGSNGGCDRSFACLALTRRPPNHYAPAAVLAAHRTKQAGRALKAAGLAMFLGGAAWSAPGMAPRRGSRRRHEGPRARSGGNRGPLPGGTPAGIEGRIGRPAPRGRDRGASRRAPDPGASGPPDHQRSARRIPRSRDREASSGSRSPSAKGGRAHHERTRRESDSGSSICGAGSSRSRGTTGPPPTRSSDSRTGSRPCRG